MSDESAPIIDRLLDAGVGADQIRAAMGLSMLTPRMLLQYRLGRRMKPWQVVALEELLPTAAPAKRKPGRPRAIDRRV